MLDIAQSKFSEAINSIALHDAHYLSQSDVFSPTTSGILTYIDLKCEESMQKEINITKSSLNTTIPIYSLVAALNYEDHAIPGIFDDAELLSPEILQGIICVMLAEIVMSLALCHKMKGNHQDYQDLCQAGHRLHLVSKH
jgi:hypothetical protein